MRKANYRACVTLLGTAMLGGLIVTTVATGQAQRS